MRRKRMVYRDRAAPVWGPSWPLVYTLYTRRVVLCPAFGARVVLSPQFRASFKDFEGPENVLRILGKLLNLWVLALFRPQR